MDWHVLRDVEFEPLEVAEEHNGVVAHIRDVSSCGRRPVEVGVDDDLLLGEIDDRHVVAVVETFDVIELDDPRSVGDGAAIAEGLQLSLIHISEPTRRS